MDEGSVEDEVGGWIIILDFGGIKDLLGFVNESQARAAFEALKPAIVMDDAGADLILQERDENRNYITIDEAKLR